jgi:hypothetical protein
MISEINFPAQDRTKSEDATPQLLKANWTDLASSSAEDFPDSVDRAGVIEVAWGYRAGSSGRSRARLGTFASNNRAREHLERVKGIEPSYSAWKAAALPLSYTRAQAMNYHAGQAASTAHAPYGPLNRQRIHAYTDVPINNERR